jgi:hypothetical protein
MPSALFVSQLPTQEAGLGALPHLNHLSDLELYLFSFERLDCSIDTTVEKMPLEKANLSKTTGISNVVILYFYQEMYRRHVYSFIIEFQS